VARSEGETRLDYTHEEGVYRVVFREDHFIFQPAILGVLVGLLGKHLEVCLKVLTDLILGEVELDTPDIHIVLEELNRNLFFKFT
jgi:hypothetical protein